MKFYTYLWLRYDGTPYYAGKGMRSRAFRKGSPPEDRIIIQNWESETEAFEAERFLIIFYGRKDRGEGILWNRTDGGDGVSGWTGSVEAGRRVGRSNRGRIYSQQEKQRKREESIRSGRKPPVGSHAGHKHSAESNERNRIAHLGRVPWNRGKKSAQPAWNKGKKASMEARKNMSLAKLGKTYGPRIPRAGAA